MDISSVSQRLSSEHQKIETELQNNIEKLSEIENSVEQRQNALEESFYEKLQQNGDSISLLSADTQRQISEIAQEFANIFRRPESARISDLVAKDQINIDLLLNFPNSINVQNNMAEATLGGRVRVLGIPSQIGALGNPTATKGTVYFNDSEYDINSFVLNFTDDKNIYPYFQLSLSSEITDFGSDFEEEAVYPVNIGMKGYPGKYDIEYSSSDSNLSQEDIISLVTFGFKQQQFNEQVQAQNSGALLAGGFKLLSKMAGISTGGGEAGLPRTNIQIGSEYDKNGRFLPQLTFKMEMWKGMNLALESSSNQEQKVRLDYKVSDVVRLSGQWESDNSEDTTQLKNKSGLGLDLKLKWDF